MKNQGKYLPQWSLKLGAVAFCFIWLFAIAISWAESAETNNEDEYNFSWLDPEKKIYVLQNRKFRKEGRLMLSALAGAGFNNSYKNSFSLNPRIGYYFTETWGIEIFYSHRLNSYNALFDNLKATNTNIIPSIRELNSMTGVLLNWSPWYAKLNVFNTILYFDWYFQGGVGSIASTVETLSSLNPTTVSSTTSESLFAFFIGTGHQFHMSQNFFLRLDFLLSIYSASISTLNTQKTMYSNFDVGFGLGLRF